MKNLLIFLASKAVSTSKIRTKAETPHQSIASAFWEMKNHWYPPTAFFHPKSILTPDYSKKWIQATSHHYNLLHQKQALARFRPERTSFSTKTKSRSIATSFNSSKDFYRMQKKWSTIVRNTVIWCMLVRNSHQSSLGKEKLSLLSLIIMPAKSLGKNLLYLMGKLKEIKKLMKRLWRRILHLFTLDIRIGTSSWIWWWEWEWASKHFMSPTHFWIWKTIISANLTNFFWEAKSQTDSFSLSITNSLKSHQ